MLDRCIVPDSRDLVKLSFNFIENEIHKQLAAGIIREEDGPWCGPVTLGMKKNGNYHFCVAYIGLNAQTKRESWPFPNVEEVLDSLGGFEYYTTLDGFSGFNTIPIEEDDQHLTTFRTPWGTFCYTVMPFGFEECTPYILSIHVQGVCSPLDQISQDISG